MQYWMDSEFLDDGHTIDLVSIGIVCDDGRSFYAETDFNREKASQWVRDNVLPHLTARGKSSREGVRDAIVGFMNVEQYGKPELWGWCAGYDWVAFCQLFGTMMDLPAGFPHYIRDFQYMLDERGISDDELPEQEEGLHHALADAQHLRKLWNYINRNYCWQ